VGSAVRYSASPDITATRSVASGNYPVEIDPQGAATGSITVTGYSAGPPEGARPTAGGVSRTIEITGPGLVNGVSFQGQAGQQISVTRANPTFSGSLRLIRPAGNSIASTGIASGSTSTIPPPALPTTGIYRGDLDPSSGQSGQGGLT